MSVATFYIGDTRDVVAGMADGSVDLILTSPPFLALRSYLPADHPDKDREIGSEANPAEFIDMLLELTAEWGRVLAPHGSLCIELGDTYSGSGGAGGDYMTGFHAGQPKFRQRRNPGWPLAKSLALIPELYRVALAYGINPLTGAESPAGRWRVRNTVTWCRPNPPVGALGDKYRPSTSDLVIACRSTKRWFDLDAVRGPYSSNTNARVAKGIDELQRVGKSADRDGNWDTLPERSNDGAGAPPLDHWNIPTHPFKGTTFTDRQVPCGPDDGGERITSPDCPTHADRSGLPAKEQCDERGSSNRPRPGRTGSTDTHLADEPVPADGSNDENLGHEGSSQDRNSKQNHPPDSQPATAHNKTSHKTGHAQSTNQPDTPCVQTTDDTAHIPKSPVSSEQRPDSDESSTSEACPSGRNQGTPDGNADNPSSQSSAACTCSYSKVETQSTSHYATWPPELCRIPIESMCPRHVCVECGEPRRRITEFAALIGRDGNEVETEVWSSGVLDGKGAHSNKRSSGTTTTTTTTLGWSDCGHDNWRPGIVLDPFAGSGTTLAVATGHGRDAIGIDIDERNADLARQRVGMFLTVVDTRIYEEATNGTT